MVAHNEFLVESRRSRDLKQNRIYSFYVANVELYLSTLCSFIVAESCSKADVGDLVTAWTALAQRAGHIST